MKVTIKGTRMVRTIPLKTAIIPYSFPELRIIIGKVVSMAVAPPDATGASFPNNNTNSGAKIKVNNSRKTLANNAMVPNVEPCISLIRILDKL